MRIGIYDPYLDDLGGGEKYMMTMAECLSSDNDVDVFWNDKKDLENVIQRFALDLSKVSIVKNIFSPGFSKWRRILESKKYDAIIFLSDGSIPFVLSKKLFIHLQQPLQSFQKNKFKMGRVNKIFYNSEYTKLFNQQNLSIPEAVIYPPVNFFPKKIKKENIILNVGRFRVRDIRTIKNGKNIPIGDYKKQSVMISVFKEMIDQGLKNWKFVIAVSIKSEDQEDFDLMKDSAKGYPIDFLINKDNDGLWDIYSRAKVYWHASGFGEDLEKHPEFAEHFGISTVEAMGAGDVPVVINAGGQKEIVEDGVNGYAWNTTNDLKKKTLNIINDEKLRSKLSKKAQEVTKKFGRDKFCKEISDMIL